MPLPTKPGYYWRHGPNEDGIVLDQVVEVDNMITTETDEFFYWETGSLGGTYIKEEEGVKWSGPLEPNWDEPTD